MRDLVQPSTTNSSSAVAQAAPSSTSPAAPKTNPETAASAKALSPEDRSTSFLPVEGGNEMQSGERLLVEAYAAIWLVIFVFIWLGFRRQTKLETRIGSLEEALAKARAAEKTSGG